MVTRAEIQAQFLRGLELLVGAFNAAMALSAPPRPLRVSLGPIVPKPTPTEEWDGASGVTE